MEKLLHQYIALVLLHRLSDEKAANRAPYVDRSFREMDKNRKERSSCYFAGCFHSEHENVSDRSYGRTLEYIEHFIGGTVYML